jgi:transposase
MSAYSLDLREKIVESVKEGVPKAETARRFGIHRATVKRYCKHLDERGTLEPRKAPGKITEAGREGYQAARRRSRREAIGYPFPEGRVPFRRQRG